MTHTAPQTPTVPHSTLTNGRTRTAAGATVFPPVFLTSHAPVTARSPVGLRLSEFFPSCSHPSPLTPTDSDHGWPITHSFLSIVSHSLLCLPLARSASLLHDPPLPPIVHLDSVAVSYSSSPSNLAQDLLTTYVPFMYRARLKGGPRLRECNRQSQAEVKSKSSNKIHQTWNPLLAKPCRSTAYH